MSDYPVTDKLCEERRDNTKELFETKMNNIEQKIDNGVKAIEMSSANMQKIADNHREDIIKIFDKIDGIEYLKWGFRGIYGGIIAFLLKVLSIK